MSITGIKFRHFLQIVLAINPAETQSSFPQYFPYESYSDGVPHPLFVVLKNNPNDKRTMLLSGDIKVMQPQRLSSLLLNQNWIHLRVDEPAERAQRMNDNHRKAQQ